MKGSVDFNSLSKGPWHVKDPCMERFGDHLSSLHGPFHRFAHSLHQCLLRAFCLLDARLGSGNTT